MYADHSNLEHCLVIGQVKGKIGSTNYDSNDGSIESVEHIAEQYSNA